MIEKKENNGVWKYFWTAGGMLKAVQRPDGEVFAFKYDAFGRRISKAYHRREFLYIWDKNVPLHEIQKEELCEDNIITWVFEGFTPTAKLINGKAYSIISDHIGTPILAIDTNGVKVWERELDIYGKVRKEFTSDDVANRRSGFMPFLYAGQYYDKETDLAYNRFRYYSTDTGTYISQDPIRLAGNNPTLYGYVTDTNTWVDVFGLDCSQEILRNVNSLMGRKKEEIQKQLQEQGFSKTEARNGGEIWIKAGDDGKTVAIRLDPAKVRQRPRGYADEVPHAHKEIILSDKVVNGNYDQQDAIKFDDLGNESIINAETHIRIME